MQPPYFISIPFTLTLILLTLILPSSARPNKPSHATPSTFPPTTLSPSPSPTALRPRANEAIILNNGWSLHYNTIDIIAPNIPIAASSLLQFYDLILASLEAEGDWEPRQRVFASTPGGGIKLGLYAAETLITREWLGAFVRALVCFDFLSVFCWGVGIEGLVVGWGKRGGFFADMWRSVEETGGGDA